MTRVRETETAWEIKCPACGWHLISKDGRWAMSGTHDKPTFHPSINECVNPITHKDYRPDCATTRCHFVISEGRIKFCDDCSHDLRGQERELEEFIG